jgi:hypothetical protein
VLLGRCQQAQGVSESGPWAVGGAVWLRSPQLRVECLLMKSYHQILFHTSKNFKIFFFTGMFRFLAAHLTAATMSRSLFKISEGSVSWYLVSGMSLLYIYIYMGKAAPSANRGTNGSDL